LFLRQLDDAGCPELVGIQEANPAIMALLDAGLPDTCGGRYELVSDADAGNDREVVLTTDRVLGHRRERLAGPLRTVFWVRVASDAGIVEFVTTHLASSSDDRPCDANTCPPPCRTGDMVNTCQARQVVALVDELAHPDAVVVIGGDMNAHPDEPTISVFRDAGFTDTHLAAGNDECASATGAGCTSGRVDDAMTDLTDPESTQTERLDYLFVGGGRSCDAAEPTGLFNAEPATAGPRGLAFPSDHTGVEATLRCETTDAERRAASAADVALTTTTTTTLPGGGEVDPATEAAITKAFSNVFDGDVTDVEVKLASIEDAERIRPHFIESYEATKAIAARIRSRIDDISLVDASHADVTYTLLLDGAPVLDHLPGAAVRQDGAWLMTLRTYCEVSTQGADEIPELCRE
jgi:endonuclease/exonuclease/phosphatase family metal-dependent hydrolase